MTVKPKLFFGFFDTLRLILSLSTTLNKSLVETHRALSLKGLRVKEIRVENEISNFNSINKNKLINIEGLDLFNDFDSIASLLKSLDVFVTISNSTAHLAGALGVKTILIKPENFAVFHYWNQKTDNTPWYGSVKLIDKKDFLQNSEFLNNFLRI